MIDFLLAPPSDSNMSDDRIHYTRVRARGAKALAPTPSPTLEKSHAPSESNPTSRRLGKAPPLRTAGQIYFEPCPLPSFRVDAVDSVHSANGTAPSN
ncbi:hypothetical protein X882_4648 [Burkholderia pseudomallei MSHR4303]|nr:hypothetical protein X882_4648 [Burkholderia pseudomallei MSHR4303]